jgi:hypothetical protein
MTTQPQYPEATGSTEPGGQYPTEQRTDATADTFAAPTQPTHPTDPEAYRSEPTAEPGVQYPTEQRTDATADTFAASAQPTLPTDPEAYGSEPAGEPNPQSHSHAADQQVAEGSADSLFASHDLTGLRGRWDEVQAGFVDDPRQCVQTADGLVSDVVQQLTNGFSDARAKLEQQWARGEDVSTEDLRQALKRYREFFDRLLAV